MFEKITPEEAGISSALIAEYISDLNRRGMPMHSVLMMKGDKLFAEYYWAPFHKDKPHRMYSQTKSYVAVAIGLLLEDGLVELDRPIADYFPDKITAPLQPRLASQTVRETLTMTTVGAGGSWFASDEPDRTRYYFDRRDDKLRIPGTLWQYDSAGSQVLSALVERLSGKSLFDFLDERIFRHLGTFRDATVLKTRNGDSWGDSALLCTPRDMASFARFVMNYGTYNGVRLMNEDYLRCATSRLVDNSEHTKNVFRHGYGYQIWRTESDGFAFVGMGGQFTICLPKLDLIFLCTADVQGIINAYDFIVDRFFDKIVYKMKAEPLTPSAEARELLENATSALQLYSLKGMEDSPFRQYLDGREYLCKSNPMGIESFSFEFSPDGKAGCLVYKNGQGKKRLPFGVNHNAFGKFPQYGYSGDYGGLPTADGSTYEDAVSFAWVEERKISIYVQIIDRYLGNSTWHFAFKGNECTLRMIKTAEDFLSEYEGTAVALTE